MIAWLVALALVLGAPKAAAQAPEVVPPKILHDAGVSYPQEAQVDGIFERVTVDLVLEIDKTGLVTRALVQTPKGHGFDEAASEAALRIEFSPALRGGKPVPAKIRFKYSFDPPVPTLVGRVIEHASGEPIAGARVTVRTADGKEHHVLSDENGSWTLPGVPRGATHVDVASEGRVKQETDVKLVPGQETRVVAYMEDEALPPEAKQKTLEPGKSGRIEVIVQGEKLAPAVQSFTRAEVRELPGAFGDPFRAIEALPGVTPIISGLPFFYVRGAPPGNVGYFLDNVRVPYLYHIAIGPSVVHPALVDRVDLYSGGYPAAFGRFAGGIVSAETTTPRTDAHGEGNIRLFDAGALVETGFAGGRGTVLVGGRYSYTAAIVSLLSPGVTLDYRDYQARVSYDVTRHDRLSVFAFGSYDLLAQTTNGIETVLFGSEFYRGDFRWDHAYRSGNVRTAVTLGYDQTRVTDQRNAIDKSIGIRSIVHQQLDSGVLLRAGADTVVDNYSADTISYSDPEDPTTVAYNNLFPPRRDLAAGTWADLVLDVTPRIEVTPGLRLDLYASGGHGAVGVDPRIAARFKISDTFRIVHAYGIAHQPPSFVVPVPGLTPGNLEGGLQTSYQTSAGVEWDFAEATTASGTLFYDSFFNMSDTIGTSVGSSSGGSPLADRRSLGSGVGFELLVRRKLANRLGGFLSYTLSRSMRSLGNETFPSAFDRTHVFNAAIGYDLGRHWRAGTRFVFYTGTPLYPSTGGLIQPPRSQTPDRNPPFYRIDLRLEKRWQLAHTAWVSFVAEFLNATLHKETFNNTEIGPVSIPSVGVEGGF